MRAMPLTALALWACIGLATAAAKAPPPVLPKPAPGLRSYRYEANEIVNGAPQSGYRVDFDLLTGSDGSIRALVRSTRAFSAGKGWMAPEIAPACLTAMHAPPGGVAQVTLWPLSDAAVKGLGSAFLDDCAPGPVFFPLTDILNVTLIAASPAFRVQDLHQVGDVARYDAFTTTFDRAGERFKETAHGGAVRLMSLADRRAVIDWSPEPAELELEQKGPQGQPMLLQGTERWAFRLTFDVRTGALQRATATQDDIDLAVSLAGAKTSVAQVAIKRTVTVDPR
jgi:hypothetical protein